MDPDILLCLLICLGRKVGYWFVSLVSHGMFTIAIGDHHRSIHQRMHNTREQTIASNTVCIVFRNMYIRR
jgi:hypothetical protein